jgi:hypothetical protein
VSAPVRGAEAAHAAVPTPAPARLKVGVWVDDEFTKIDAAFAERLLATGITEACLMTNKMNAHRSAEPWKLRAPETTIVRAARTLREAGIEVVLTCWPRPSKTQIATLVEDMAPLMRDTKAVGLEVDAEANWTFRFLEGFTTMGHAAEHLAEQLRVAAQGARVEMTTFALHRENSKDAELAPLVNAIFPQAYSVNERDGKEIPWDHPFGPGNMQEVTLEHARKTGCATVGLGLAAYEQSWPGHTIEEAMHVALERARSLGVEHVRYWSSKWIVGTRAQAAARKAITAFR